MNDLKKGLTKLRDRIDGLSLRERTLVFVAAPVTLFVLATNLLFAPLWNGQDLHREQLASKHEQIEKFESQLQKILARASVDPDAENRAKLAALREQLGTIDTALAEQTAGLVSPQEMAKLVEEMLKQNRTLELVKFESLTPTRLGNEAEQQQDEPAVTKLDYVVYRHGTRIQFRGRYADIVDYLEALERLPWKMFWGEATLETEKFPLSRFTLVLYTLSLREAWIGV